MFGEVDGNKSYTRKQLLACLGNKTDDRIWRWLRDNGLPFVLIPRVGEVINGADYNRLIQRLSEERGNPDDDDET